MVAIRIGNISKYETEIIWDKSRKLQTSDFKGNIENRPAIAATSSSFRYNYWSDSGINQPIILKVETYFDTKLSYFRRNRDSLFVLVHEQLHFDITELYARKFIKRVQDEVVKSKNIQSNLTTIGNEVIFDLQIEQDRYDAEIYRDSTKQSQWNNRIKERLDSLADFEQKKILIR